MSRRTVQRLGCCAKTTNIESAYMSLEDYSEHSEGITTTVSLLPDIESVGVFVPSKPFRSPEHCRAAFHWFSNLLFVDHNVPIGSLRYQYSSALAYPALPSSLALTTSILYKGRLVQPRKVMARGTVVWSHSSSGD